MYECFQDPERENKWYLRSDASVSCEPSLEKTIVNIHVLAFSALVGVGFPLFSFLKIRSLRKAGKLDFDSSFANLFQFYNTRMPYFETAQFSRKGLLIFVLTLSADNPVVQAVLSLGINGGFLILLIWTRPFVYYPTSHSKRDLFQIAEVSSTVTCLIGNTLALIGSLKMSDQSYIDVLGGVLATTNIAYFILLMFKYRAEVTRSAKKEAAWALQVKRYKKNRNLGGELLKALGEWHTLVMSLEDNNLDERRRLQIVDEMPFAKSRIVADMRIMLMKVEEKHWMNLTHQISETFNEESFKQKCRRCQRALNPVNDDFEKFVGEARGPFTVQEIAREQKLEFVIRKLGRSDSSWERDSSTAEEGKGNNPLQIEMTPTAVKNGAEYGKAHIARSKHFKQEYKARTNSKSKLKSKTSGKATVPSPTTTLVTSTTPQILLGNNPLPPPPTPPAPLPTTTLAPSSSPQILLGNPNTALLGLTAPPPPPLSPPTPPAPTPPAPTPTPDPWISVTDANGKLYYIHRETNEAVWEKP
ncbi:hypothetical protein TrLO_g2433 [Triparma laevis f. longispina]|uniref:WW domain-containing protein n=1 Tax=Triparma laevis f. longispina TaxID=1714387 RepID=A0A9W7FLZ4_9STRA|nr:hypothetical protein TrLO_g2433 [Triparma laevis f. longispina]